MTGNGASVAFYRSRSLWLDALDDCDLVAQPSLVAERNVDVAIVGAGFTGLWTALYLRALDPGLRVAVVEAEIAGFGASGRNGGWCSALLPMSLPAVAADHGHGAAVAMARAMQATVDEVGRAARSLGIDCHFAKGGYVRMARSAQQAARLHDELAEARAFGLGDDDVRWLDAREAASLVGASRVSGALFTPHCAAIQPARLARGLARAVVERGVDLYEQTAVTAIDGGVVHTSSSANANAGARGTLRAEVVVRATEAFTAGLRGHRRDLAPLYSLMIATEPLPPDVWTSLGMAARPTWNDARRTIIYGQRTADDRLAFGGRGAPYHFGSAIKAAFDRHDRTHFALREVLCELFPALSDAAVTHAWGGPLGVPRDWRCSVGFDRARAEAWAGGYVGDGVATTNLAGRTLAALITGVDDPIVRLPWVGHRSPRWEPEPLRWLGINATARLPGSIDRAEAAGRAPSRLAVAALDRLTGH